MDDWNYFDNPPAESGNYRVKTMCGVTTTAYYNLSLSKWELYLPYSWIDVELWRSIN